jgi:hypothetical protein
LLHLKGRKEIQQVEVKTKAKVEMRRNTAVFPSLNLVYVLTLTFVLVFSSTFAPVFTRLIPIWIQDADRGGSEELAAGVLKYVEEKR